MKIFVTSLYLLLIFNINLKSNPFVNNEFEQDHIKTSNKKYLNKIIDNGIQLLDKGETDSVKLLLDKISDEFSSELNSNLKIYYEYNLLKGKYFNLTRDYSEAISIFESLKDEIKKEDSTNYDLLIQLYNELGYANYKKADYKKAINHYLILLRICQNYTENSIELIYILGRIVELYIFQDKNHDAREYFDRCIYLIDSLNYPGNKKLFDSYVMCALYYNLLSETDKALKYLYIAENILKSNYNSAHYKYCSLYYHHARILFNLGKLDKALIFFERSLKMAKMSDILNDYLFLNYNRLGILYYSNKNYSRSIEYNLKALKESKNSGFSPVYTYLYLGRCNHALNNLLKAEYYYNLAESLAIHESGIIHPAIQHIYNSKSYLYRKKKDDKNEIKYLELAYNSAIRNNVYKSVDVTWTLLNLGRYYYRMHDFKRSLDTLQKALISVTENFNNTDIYINPDIEDATDKMLLAPIIKRKAYVFFNYYDKVTGNIIDLKASLKCYKMANKLQEKINISFNNEKTKFDFLANQKVMLNNTVELALDVYELTNDYQYLKDAFIYAEKSKAIVLLTHINEKQAKQFADIPDSLLYLEQSIKNEIAGLDYQINNPGETEYNSPYEVDAIKSRLFELTRKEEELIRLFEMRFPRYYNLKYNRSVAPLGLIQSSLEENQALIEYTVTWKELYTFVITRDTLTVHTQDINNSFSEHIVKFRGLLSENKYGNYCINDYNDFVEISYNLYNILIQPVISQIKNKSLIIVPDEILNLIPFEVLISNNILKSDIADFGELPYLFKEFPVCYNYSASLLKNQKENRHKGNRLIAFVPEYPDVNYHLQLKNDTTIDDLYNLNPLIGTKEEVNYISRLYRSRVYTNKQALEENFKKSAGDYSIIHLAMHTIVNDRSPMLSNMVFTPKEDKKEDGLLHTFELYGIKLKADLVVLSGCNTGYGKMQKGEGLLSLARGFVFSGCSGLLLTQWSVADKASVKLMKYFYYHLSKGHSKEKALHYAKIDYLKDADPVKTHPYYWASYIVFGDTCPLPSKRGSAKYFIIAVVLILIIFIYFLRRNKSRDSGNLNGRR